MSEFDLDHFERWMFEAIRQPGGLVEDEMLAKMVNPSARRTRAQRLGVYANMYFWRLVGILRDEFAALAYALGDDFHDRMVQYLVAHPSRHYRLAPLGEHMACWLAEEAEELEHRDFLADLAALERAKEEVFDEARSEPLDPIALAGISAERWADARLELVPALRLLESRYPVNAYFQQVMNQEDPVIPEARPSWAVTWRHEFVVWRHDLTAEQHAILTAIAAGRTLGESLEAAFALGGLSPDELVASVGSWFQMWTADGLFAPLSAS